MGGIRSWKPRRRATRSCCSINWQQNQSARQPCFHIWPICNWHLLFDTIKELFLNECVWYYWLSARLQQLQCVVSNGHCSPAPTCPSHRYMKLQSINNMVNKVIHSYNILKIISVASDLFFLDIRCTCCLIWYLIRYIVTSMGSTHFHIIWFFFSKFPIVLLTAKHL